jgi:malonyl-CoA/methylmalonyl-CoA synthetase
MTLPLFERAQQFKGRTAIVAPEGVFSYDDLLETSRAVAGRLLRGRPDLQEARVCFLVPSGWVYAAVQWGVWRAGGVAVPMAVSHPPAELAHVLDDAEPECVVAHPDLLERVASVASEREIPILETPALLLPAPPSELPELDPSRAAMMLYTSGTTGKPKGVVTSHSNTQAQVESLSEAWGWSKEDRILLHLPLHHVHGIINVLTSALWNGATCEILPSFDAPAVWERLASGDLSLYMAVPTVYRRLIEAWDAAEPAKRESWSRGAASCRLMISGSAALPVPTLERWEEISGHRLLERYGMTEIGMALSNPLEGERRPGSVGLPLPGMEVRLVDDEGQPVEPGTPGQIQVRGPNVFGFYWRRPEATSEAFTSDGWFETGDQAVMEKGRYRILGRSSVDILKTGGEKISALEVEDVLRTHEAVRDCAVVGVPDPVWGDRVCAAVVAETSAEVTGAELQAFAKERLAPYKVPKDILLLADLPRNAMGKVTKPAVSQLFVADDAT